MSCDLDCDRRANMTGDGDGVLVLRDCGDFLLYDCVWGFLPELA